MGWLNDARGGDRSSIRGSFPFADEMAACPQDSLYHAEGDVWTHTMMVLDNIERHCENLDLVGTERAAALRFAALLHDCAKPETTEIAWCDKEGRERVRQPNHAAKGAAKAWRALIDASAPVMFAREVVNLVSWHQRPTHILEQNSQAARICRYTAEGGRWDDLLTFCASDQAGRISPNIEEGLFSLDLLREDIVALGMQLGADLLTRCDVFGPETRALFGQSHDVNPFYSPVIEREFTLTIMSGLPGSGKSTWIDQNASGAIVVSMDDIRAESPDYKRSPKHEGRCLQEAQRQLREAMANKQDVVWDSTCLDRRSRDRIVRLGNNYGAKIRIISADAPLAICLRRNAEREDPVPDAVMRRFAENREMVLATEGHEILSLRDGRLSAVIMHAPSDEDVTPSP